MEKRDVTWVTSDLIQVVANSVKVSFWNQYNFLQMARQELRLIGKQVDDI